MKPNKETLDLVVDKVTSAMCDGNVWSIMEDTLVALVDRDIITNDEADWLANRLDFHVYIIGEDK